MIIAFIIICFLAVILVFSESIRALGNLLVVFGGLPLGAWLLIIATIIFLAGAFTMLYKSNSDPNEKTFDEKLEERGFVISKKVEVGQATLYVDNENKKWTLRGSSMPKIKRFSFDQLLEYELFEDGSSIVSGKSGSALLGGVLGGSIGATIGSSGSRSVSETVSTSQIQLIIDDLSSPSITLDLIKGSISRGSISYREYRKKAHKMLATFRYIQEHANDE